MSRAGKRLGNITIGGPEDRRFRSFFGAGVTVVLLGWQKMKDQGLIPERGLVVHYLWALMFMKLYSNEAALCGHAGGVDPKTFRKWIWPFIRAISELEYTVVSCILAIMHRFTTSPVLLNMSVTLFIIAYSPDPL